MILARRRATAQLLHRPGGVDVVGHLLAVQAQDPRAAQVALWARADRPGSDRVVGWLLRGTLHLVRREDYWWLHALTAPRQLTASARRLGQEGVTPAAADRAVALIERWLEESGPLTRAGLGARLAAAGVRVEGQALAHLLRLAALRGVAVIDGDAFALARSVVGPRVEVDRAVALAELARRYLVGHAPADAADLARWAGLPLRDARAGLAAVSAPAAVSEPARRIPPRLLGAFDPYLLGWRYRSFAVPPEHAARVHPGGGMIRAVAVVDGLVVGTWTLSRLELFASVAPGERAALEKELRAVRALGTDGR